MNQDRIVGSASAELVGLKHDLPPDARASSPASPLLLRPIGSVLRSVESLFDRAFGERVNPWRSLGALGFYLYWIVAVSGIYIYIFFDTSVVGAYDSVERLTREQWYAGGIMRSLHRYASDAFVVVMFLHLARELVSGRYYNFRWFSWVSGVPLIWLAYLAGIGGYWLVWDQLAQFSAVATAEWLDFLPIFGEPIVRNFLTPASINDRFFSLLVFAHIGIPLVLLLGMWIHIQRISRARVLPPRALALGTLAMLLAASLLRPALSHDIAELSSVPESLQLDWFYLFVHPLMYGSSPGQLWALACAFTMLLLVVPLLPHPKPKAVAEVSPANCNGCARCFADCPYAAVIMRPHPDKPGHQLASVLTDLCAGCGICAGACPSSTPFRSDEQIVSGIDMPQLSIAALRAKLERGLATFGGETKVVVFGCDCAADVRALAGPDTTALSLPCTGMLPPSFVEYAIRDGADGVMLTGCVECAYRLGNRWVEERLNGARQPLLRANVSRERVRVVWAGTEQEAHVAQELALFRRTLRELGRPAAHARSKRKVGHRA